MENNTYNKHRLPAGFLEMIEENDEFTISDVVNTLNISFKEAFLIIKDFSDEGFAEEIKDGVFKVKGDIAGIEVKFIIWEKWYKDWTYEVLLSVAPELFMGKYFEIAMKISKEGSVEMKNIAKGHYLPECTALKKRGVLFEKNKSWYSTVPPVLLEEFAARYKDKSEEENADVPEKALSPSSENSKDETDYDFNDEIDDFNSFVADLEAGVYNEEFDRGETLKKLFTEKTISFSDAEYVEFGTYPQDEVLDEKLTKKLNRISGKVPTLVNPNGWLNYYYYAKSEVPFECWWFKDVEYNGRKYRGVYFTAAREEDRNNYIEYEIPPYRKRKVHWFEFSPIRWLVLSESKDKMFLLCDAVLDSQPFHSVKHNENPDTGESDITVNNSWRKSTIRKWLSSVFFYAAFSDEEKERIEGRIISTENINGKEEKTIDKVYLASYGLLSDPDYGFDDPELNDVRRSLKATDYAVCQGLGVDTDLNSLEQGAWWIRDPDRDGCVVVVMSTGHITQTVAAECTAIGVVPAITVKINK